MDGHRILSYKYTFSPRVRSLSLICNLLAKKAMASTLKLSRLIHMGRVLPEVEPNVSRQLEENAINLKRVRTRRNHGLVRLPAQLELAAQNKIKQFAVDSRFRNDVKRLVRIMYHMKAPDSQESLEVKKSDIKTELELRGKIDDNLYYRADVPQLAEDRDLARFELDKLIEGTLEDRRRDWHYYEYDEYASNLYMATRLAPNYACLKVILNEVRDIDPSIEPESVLDFGSGLGTTCWAVNETWPDKVKEFMNIDLSKEQQYLCEYLLRGGKEFGNLLPGIYHRQYLPGSDRVKYDMVVSAFSLLELPNAELRASVIENLWHKTKDLLVLVERGNKGGFDMINEARSLILDLNDYDVTDRVQLSSMTQPLLRQKNPSCHIFAPCPHEFLCPRLHMPSKRSMNSCRFRVAFEPMEIGERKPGFVAEEFSYVVIRKKPFRNYFDEASVRWPRIVEKRKHSGGQIQHKICCPNGCLAEVTVTKKYGKNCYDIAKSCDWGDLLPIRVRDTYVRKSSFNGAGALSDDDKSHEE